MAGVLKEYSTDNALENDVSVLITSIEYLCPENSITKRKK